LESAAHAGLVKGGDERLKRRGDEEFGWDVLTFARECVANAASQSVPFVEAARRVFFSLRQVTTDGGISEHAYAYSVAEAAEAFVALDRRLASRLVGNAVAARASAATGAALLRAALVAFGKPTTRSTNDSSQDEDESSFFSEGLTEALRRAKGVVTRSEKERGTRLPGAHLAVVFGAVAGSAGFSARTRGSYVLLPHAPRHAQRGDAAKPVRPARRGRGDAPMRRVGERVCRRGGGRVRPRRRPRRGVFADALPRLFDAKKSRGATGEGGALGDDLARGVVRAAGGHRARRPRRALREALQQLI
jgi:hypothetical protein